MRAGLRGGGEGVGVGAQACIAIVGGVCPSHAADFSSLLLAFFPRWSDCIDGCSGIDEHGFAGGCNGSSFFFCMFSVFVCNKGGGFPSGPS
ncbi:hypothetical protein TIFTF001_030954 [Ficus carica]|uniref:Uncharacterized protein n=1 Tax=Ficus carica TaxID=3494 RepID=A0AA88DU63_FICCA|nr:hypothetical protein TIFTF001_030954 [Ficus carica]